MKVSLVLALCLGGVSLGLPSPPWWDGRRPELPWHLEDLRRRHLESLRRDREFLEETVKMWERGVELYESLDWPEQARQNRQYARKTREQIRLIAKWEREVREYKLERELIEQERGSGNTAPPPRPVTRGD